MTQILSEKKLLIAQNIEIAYFDEGENHQQTLLFIHGLGSNKKAWVKNIPFLSQYYRCIAIDLIGYGNSTYGNFQYSMNLFADMLIAFVTQNNLSNITLVGHSMGGQVAAIAALKRRDLFHKLVLVATAGVETFADFQKTMIKQLYHPSLVKNQSSAQIRKNFEINFYQWTSEAEFMVQERIAFVHEKAKFDAYCKMIPQCVAAMMSENFAQFLPQIQVPTMVIFGKQDALVPNKWFNPFLSPEGVAQLIYNKIPDCQKHLFNKAGHFVQFEVADVFNQAVLDFV